MLDKDLKTPYYAVIFVSRKSENLEGYAEMDERVMALAQQQEGYLGYESAGDLKQGIFISYWGSLEAIDKWRRNPIHIDAKSKAVDWYTYYHSQISKVEYAHRFVK